MELIRLVGDGLCMSINLTQNNIHDNDVGVITFGKSSTYELYFVDNNVTLSTRVPEQAFHTGEQGLIVSRGQL